MTTMDPLEKLREIEEIARQAQRDLQSGHAKTGASALAKIEHLAQDTRRWTKAAA